MMLWTLACSATTVQTALQKHLSGTIKELKNGSLLMQTTNQQLCSFCFDQHLGLAVPSDTAGNRLDH